MPDLIRISVEHATSKLLSRDWMWEKGFWRPTIATVEANLAITPGDYTMDDALAFYGYCVEDD